MRRFHSYGPVDEDIHFSVPRTDFVQQYLDQFIGNLKKGGHYFTVWAPRQSGKTWLTQQVRKRIEAEYPDQFTVGMMSMQGTILLPDDPPEAFLNQVDYLMEEAFDIHSTSAPNSWNAFKYLFHKDNTCFKRPVILFIDEFDSLPPAVIDRLVTLFRDIYLKRDRYLLHGLSLIGVRAVLGVDSQRGSPFNIQRSLHVPNFTLDEVTDLFDQYQQESGQIVEPEVSQSIYESTNGQPGLVGWFGELLTEKYNPGQNAPIDASIWNTVLRKALFVEWNNTVLNLVKKVRSGYVPHIQKLFSSSDVPFSLDAGWCGYLYLNGVIMPETSVDKDSNQVEVCRFSCPFIQKRLYNALTDDLIGDLPMLAVDPMDDLADVFEGEILNLSSLLDRYKAYLVRMKAKGLNPFKDQPRRTDLHYTEAVGHFHLYAWMKQAVEDVCVISPEFPTGNGKVDLHLKCRDKFGIIEIKSFRSHARTQTGILQAASYARSLNLTSVTIALFVPLDDVSVLASLSKEIQCDGVVVTVVAIGWT
jgi:AAA-like domain